MKVGASRIATKSATKKELLQMQVSASRNATKSATKKKTVCLASKISSKTTTEKTNASDEVGITAWREMGGDEKACLVPGGAFVAFEFCGPGTLMLYTSNDPDGCSSPARTISHNTNSTMADCKTEETTVSDPWYSYKYECAPGSGADSSLSQMKVGASRNATKSATKKKTVCLASKISSKTTTEKTNSSDKVGITSCTEMGGDENTCLVPGGAFVAFEFCGPGKLMLFTSNNPDGCSSPARTISHGTNSTMADCTTEETTVSDP